MQSYLFEFVFSGKIDPGHISCFLINDGVRIEIYRNQPVKVSAHFVVINEKVVNMYTDSFAIILIPATIYFKVVIAISCFFLSER